MKTIKVKKSYSKIRECRSFFSWLLFEANFPWMPKGEERWFSYLGSNHRIQYWRIFGHETETEYIGDAE